ncbi:MAG: L-threonylcarbamoyladenylate synthase [Bacteroidota bacterium]
MNIIEATTEAIENAAQVIRSGRLVAFPTETVYGLGTDGLNPIAVAKIFETKRRPTFNPLILHIASKNDLQKFAFINDDRIENLINKFWPGPLTLVLLKREIVPDIVTSGNSTVAIRMPRHPVALQLIEKSGSPIAAPSANKFGHLSPTEASHVYKSIGDKVDLILDGGKCSVGVESTIIQFNEGRFLMLRPGGLSREEIENEIGKVEVVSKFSLRPNAPGQLLFHYAPSIPLFFLTKENLEKYSNKKIGVLFFKNVNVDYNFKSIRLLSEKGDMKEAAANLFKYLHELEKENIDLILAEPVEETGLGAAIMDRLKKGTARFLN